MAIKGKELTVNFLGLIYLIPQNPDIRGILAKSDNWPKSADRLDEQTRYAELRIERISARPLAPTPCADWQRRGFRYIIPNFLVWDTESNCGKTGDASNITLFIAKDNSSAIQTTNAAAEVSSANMPGIYKITLTAAEMEGDFICVSGRSPSDNTVVYPVFIQTERGDLDAILNILSILATKNDVLAARDAITTPLGQITSKLPAGSGAVLAAQGDITTAQNTITSHIDESIGDSLTQIVSALPTGTMEQETRIASKSDINNFSGSISDGVKLHDIGRREVVDDVRNAIIGATLNELSNTPNASPTLSQAIMLQYMALRNKTVNTQSKMKIYKDDCQAVLSEANLSDVDNIFTKEKLVNPQ